MLKLKKLKPPKYSNLSEKGTERLEKLKATDDIAITIANKGGEVLILDVKDYEKECERQPNNT